jgi:hypothetical protein
MQKKIKRMGEGWVGGGAGYREGVLSQCVMQLQELQLRTNLEKCFAVDMALCAIPSEAREEREFKNTCNRVVLVCLYTSASR